MITLGTPRSAPLPVSLLLPRAPHEPEPSPPPGAPPPTLHFFSVPSPESPSPANNGPAALLLKLPLPPDLVVHVSPCPCALSGALSPLAFSDLLPANGPGLEGKPGPVRSSQHRFSLVLPAASSTPPPSQPSSSPLPPSRSYELTFMAADASSTDQVHAVFEGWLRRINRAIKPT
ncbi:hypothetical protein TeGR_g9847, partial [Tetraparma gracilis]